MGFSNLKNKKILLAILICFSTFSMTFLLTTLPISTTPTSDTSNNIKVSGTGYVEVTVRDSETSALIPNAYVEAINGSGTVADDYTDGSGIANLTDLDVGIYTIKVTKNAYQTQTKSCTINWEGDDDYFTFYMIAWGPGTGFIEVNVHDSVTNNTVPNVNVVCAFYYNGTVINSGTTTAGGFYNATELYIGWYTVTVSKYNYNSQSKTEYINWNGDDDYLTFYIVKKPADSGYIEINVKDNNSAPLSSAFVLVEHDNGTFANSGYTNGSGFYNSTGLIIGWYKVTVSKSGYHKEDMYNYINWEGDDDYLFFQLDPWGPNTGYFEVTVRDYLSTLLSGAYVFVIERDSGNEVSSGQTNGSGFYNATGLNIGWYDIYVYKSGYATEHKAGFINWNGDDDYLTYYMDPIDDEMINITINVRRSDAHWLGVGNALIKVFQGGQVAAGSTLTTGTFQAYNLGNYSSTEIQVTRSGYGSNTTIIDLSGLVPHGIDYEVTIYLTGGPSGTGWIEVTVKDLINGSDLIENAAVLVQYPNGTWIDWGLTDSNGFKNITGLLEYAWYKVNISATNYISQEKSTYMHFPKDDDYITFNLNRISFTSQTLTLQTITPNPDPTGDIDLYWNVLPFATGYTIYRGTLPGSLEIVATVGAGVTTYKDIGVTGNIMYYQIIATDGIDILQSNTESVEIYQSGGSGAIPGFELVFMIIAMVIVIVVIHRKKLNFKSFFNNI